jgi:hypothetical protein
VVGRLSLSVYLWIHPQGWGREEGEVGGMYGEGSAGCLQISLLEGVSRVQYIGGHDWWVSHVFPEGEGHVHD